MKATVWQEVEVTVDLGVEELRQIIAQQWEILDYEGNSLAVRIAEMYQIFEGLNDDQIKSIPDKHKKTLTGAFKKLIDRFEGKL